MTITIHIDQLANVVPDNQSYPLEMCRLHSAHDATKAGAQDGTTQFEQTRITDKDLPVVREAVATQLRRLEARMANSLIGATHSGDIVTWHMRSSFITSNAKRLATTAAEAAAYHALSTWMFDKLPNKAQEYAAMAERLEAEAVATAFETAPPMRP